MEVPMRSIGSWWLSVVLAGCAGNVGGTDPGSAGDDGGLRAPEDGATTGPDGASPGSDGGGTAPCEGSDCVPRTPADDGALFAEMPDLGSVEVTLWPGGTVTTGASTLVSFGVPFPRGTVGDPGQIRVTDAAGAELAAQVETLLEWRVLGDGALERGIRSALVQVEVVFAAIEPVRVNVLWGTPRTRDLGPQPDPTTTWVPADGDDYPASEGIREPAVYATLPADWLGRCLLRSRAVPFGEAEQVAWLDDMVPEFGRTGVNDVDPRVTAGNRIDYVSDAEPWLFDRALTLFGLYVRSGELEWLRHAHRAAQFYANHIDSGGYFDLKAGDLKYAYGQPMLVDLALVGDRRMLAPIERVASAGAGWPATYRTTLGFWTERHQTYALLAALSAWEATGSASHGARAIEVARATFAMARSPASAAWPTDGCLLHTMRAHEGSADDRPICSPWMSALLADAVFRYYVQSGDEEALSFLAGLADFVATHALYDGAVEHPGLAGVIVPWYLVSSVYEFTDSGAWADLEHTCDVAGLVARGAWAREQLGGDAAATWSATDQLLASCRRNLESWHRPGGPEAGLAEWRLSPARKLSWWFGTTSDLAWVLSAR